MRGMQLQKVLGKNKKIKKLIKNKQMTKTNKIQQKKNKIKLFKFNKMINNRIKKRINLYYNK